ncbi:MAG: DUF3078 domain-containing protein [Balneolaceae bacterium]|nr:DUF3078 domain-containing protein [Balneolaceae bacterium]MDR9446555.1 DUF3078 domain-containing protein [Balneolaceae bacterium]
MPIQLLFRKSLAIAFMVLLYTLTQYSPASSQQSIVFPDTLRGGTLTWNGGVNGTQASYRNWSKGGVNTIAITGESNALYLYRNERFQYGTRLTLKYGYARLEDTGRRKTEDLIEFRHRFLYSLSPDNRKINMFANLTVSTQFNEGFNYASDPNAPDELVSSWLAPLVFSENAGLAMTASHYSLEFGLGLKQTYVRRSSIGSRYGLESDKNVRNEGGVTIGLVYKEQLMDNVHYVGNLDTFTSLVEPFNETDVNLSNTFVGEINSYLRTTFQFDLVYDRDFSSEMQVSQVLSAGIAFEF